MRLWTIGYEKASAADFLHTLKAAGIDLVCDVRDRPQSRRAGFSKRQLSAGLDEAGIAYIHLKALGTPKEGRVAHREGDLDLFWEIYEAQILKPEAQTALEDLRRLAEQRATCLVCYEADWRRCHRARIVEYLTDRQIVDVHHLGVEGAFL